MYVLISSVCFHYTILHEELRWTSSVIAQTIYISAILFLVNFLLPAQCVQDLVLGSAITIDKHIYACEIWNWDQTAYRKWIHNSHCFENNVRIMFLLSLIFSYFWAVSSHLWSYLPILINILNFSVNANRNAKFLPENSALNFPVMWIADA